METLIETVIKFKSEDVFLFLAQFQRERRNGLIQC